MKKLLLATAAVAALSTGAFAADLPSSKMAPIAPAYAPIYSWTGFYVGLQGGYQWGSTTGRTTVTGVVPNVVAVYDYDPKGGVFGAHAGYNYQFGSIVAGVEGDVEWSGLRETGGYAIGGVAVPLNSHRTKVDWQGSVRGRLGFAIDRALIYATGGVAFADMNYRVFDGAGLVGTPGNTYSHSSTRVGWTLGGGLEYALTNNITMRGEYRYTRFNSQTGTFPAAGAAPALAFNDRARTDIHTLRAGISYKF
jgi:outer membrane immunogenic protein